MFVKPAEGLSVLDPARLKQGRAAALLPADGRHVDDTDYWIRRRADGDVIEVAPSESTSMPAVDATAPQPPETAKGD